MSEKNTQLIKTVQVSKNEDELRLFPFITAGVICFTIAIILGSGSWYLFGSPRQKPFETALENNNLATVSENEKPAPAPEPAAPVAPTTAEAPVVAPENANPPANAVFENTVEVAGGEIVTGGGDTKKPLERQIVGSFLISAAEVTNAQYAEFLKDTNHPAPPGWKKSEFPAGTENFPVTNVSWRDAATFCEWMAKKTGAAVRLPSEAEWELAARGREGYKYPWGNEWKKDALITQEKGGRISAVKSFPLNRSPFGAYDMVGNVWEWTRDKVDKNAAVTDEHVREALEKGQILRIVKGGSATENAASISAQSRYEIPETTKVPMVGFRYIVERR